MPVSPSRSSSATRSQRRDGRDLQTRPQADRLLASILCILLMTLSGAESTYGQGFATSKTVVLRDGEIYQGLVEKDNTIISVTSPLKRVMFRFTRKKEEFEEASPPAGNTFQLIQPDKVEARGKFPEVAVDIQAGPWDEDGRRLFEYRNRKNRPIRMTQVIANLGPKVSRIRGLDQKWRGAIATETIPRSIVLGFLGQIDQEDQEARMIVASFLIEAQWYDEAIAELDRLRTDFPDLSETVIAGIQSDLVQLRAEERLVEIRERLEAGQLQFARRALARFPVEGLETPDLIEQLQALREEQIQRTFDDRQRSQAFRSLSDQLSLADRQRWHAPILEILHELDVAPDAVGARLEPLLIAGSSDPIESQFARLVSAWIVGPERATEDLAQAERLWRLRDLVSDYLNQADSSQRDLLLTQIETEFDGLSPRPEPGDAEASEDPDAANPVIARADLLVRMIRLMPPPANHLANRVRPGAFHRCRVEDSQSVLPTDYGVVLPPEYHPLRSYPTIVVLHSGRGPRDEADAWIEHAARSGVILILPEYLGPEGVGYTYTADEHAAVTLALRDARRRFAIDSDRVYLAGAVEGGHMAWDYGLAHPTQFAGVAAISGAPLKYVQSTVRTNSELVPLYVVYGAMAPAVPTLSESIFNQLVFKNRDVTLVSYAGRGMENLPEEIPDMVRWMLGRKRPSLSEIDKFEVRTARSVDARYNGLVVRELDDDRSSEPEVTEPSGRNLNPAEIRYKAARPANLVSIEVEGVRAFDLWLAPDLIDLDDRVRVKINRNETKGRPQLSLANILEDVRLRGDRRRIYWFKLSYRHNGRRFAIVEEPTRS